MDYQIGRNQTSLNQAFLFYPLPDLRPRFIQNFCQLTPVIHAVFKCLRHFDRICRAGYNTQVTHRTQFKMIHKFVNGFFLFPLRCNIKFCNDLNSSIRTSQFTGGTARAGMLIIFIMRHHHFTFEPFRQIQCFPVIRILLCNDLLMMRKIIKCTPKANSQ